MAQFIHLLDQRNAASIRRGGIKIARFTRRPIKGVFVQALTEDFQFTHQWMRELGRRRGPSLIAARLRIDDDEMVYIGKFNQDHLRCKAAEAIGIARSHTDSMGLEVVIPRAIRPKEIASIYRPPKVVGWRYYPAARGRRPCGCPYCQRGEPFSRPLRERYDAADA